MVWEMSNFYRRVRFSNIPICWCEKGYLR